MSASTPRRPPPEGLIARIRSFIVEDLWNLELGQDRLQTFALGSVQLVVMIAQGFVRDRLLLRASALTYVTVLALIPMLAVMVGLLQLGRGGDELVELVVGEMTAVSPEAREIVMEQVRGADLGSLGTIGATILLLTSILALRHLETTLNAIWGVEDQRTWPRRLSDYLTVMVIAPLLTGVALSLGATIQGTQVLAEFINPATVVQFETVWLQGLPWAALIAAFSFLYWFFPNTSVRPLAALAGGFVASILFSVARYFYVDLSVGVTKYNAIFGGFAALPLVLVWIYVCWAVVLFGAEVAFASQNLNHYRREVRGAEPGMAEREAIGLRVVLAIGRAFRSGEGALNSDVLSEALDLPVRVVREQVRALMAAGLLEQTVDDLGNAGVLPARPLGRITVADVFHALRGDREMPADDDEEAGADLVATAVLGRDDIVREVMREVDGAFEAVAATRSLEDLLALQRPA